MWVKAEDGRFYNLSYAHALETYPAADGFQVIARFAVGDDSAPVAELTKVKPQAETEKCLDRIGQSLEMKETFIDLTRANV
jgi:hypothetical protein